MGQRFRVLNKLNRRVDQVTSFVGDRQYCVVCLRRLPNDIVLSSNRSSAPQSLVGCKDSASTPSTAPNNQAPYPHGEQRADGELQVGRARSRSEAWEWLMDWV